MPFLLCFLTIIHISFANFQLTRNTMCMTMKGIHMTMKEMCKQYYLFSFSTSYPIFSISSDAQMNGPTPLPSLSRIGSLI